MATHNFENQQFTLEKKVVTLFANVSFGASGAPTLVSGKGISSISRSSTGTYAVTLDDGYNSLLGVEKTSISPSAAPAAPSMYVTSHTVGSSATPAINVVMNAAGTATDPASGESVMLRITLKNSYL